VVATKKTQRETRRDAAAASRILIIEEGGDFASALASHCFRDASEGVFSNVLRLWGDVQNERETEGGRRKVEKRKKAQQGTLRSCRCTNLDMPPWNLIPIL